MKSLLVGNGITIQFGGKKYTNCEIIKRARKIINTRRFPEEVYPKEALQYLIELAKIIPNVLKGEYDECTNTDDMKKSLRYFKNKYKHLRLNFSPSEIGMEDYFLIHLLFCHKQKIENPNRYEFRECLKMLFIDAIYNFGQIQSLYKKYPKKFIDFLNGFDNIYTTNYDWNLEKAAGKKVGYLHGAFHILDDTYNKESFRNKLDDCPIERDGLVTPKGYEYLHSTALMSYSGEEKEFSISMGNGANETIEKFAKGYLENKKVHDDIDTWKNADSQLVRNMYNSIKLKLKDNSLKFQEYDDFQEFKQISGELVIIGLSPCNDNHIFNNLIENRELNQVTYYYYDCDESDKIKSILKDKDLKCISVKEFWESMN